MKEKKFISGVSITFITRILQMMLGLIASVIIARVLGPEGKGIYALAILLPTLIIRFANIGIEPATTYHVAQKQYAYTEILGNNILLSLLFSGLGVLFGLVIILFFSSQFFSDVPQGILLLALLLVPVTMIFTAINQINMGAQQFFKFNAALFCMEASFLAFLSFSLLILKKGTMAALASRIMGYGAGLCLVLVLLIRFSGGIKFRLNKNYIKNIFHYGIRAHLGNLIAFLNLRLDLLLINHFMDAKDVGQYSISVGLAERLWMVSSVISVVLLPLIASEKDKKKKKEFTPRVTRGVFLFNSMGYLLIFLLGAWIITLLYSKQYAPAITPLKILIIGAFPLSVAKVLSTDIAGRGKPMINTYQGAAVLVINVILNILLIPRFGIIGAAWATTISYLFHSILKVVIYCRISGNSWRTVLIPTLADLMLYKEKSLQAIIWLKGILKKKSGNRPHP